MKETRLNTRPSQSSYDDVGAISPALEHYTMGPLFNGLWKRPEISPRDRSIVTVAALIARIQTIEVPFRPSARAQHGRLLTFSIPRISARFGSLEPASRITQEPCGT